MQSWLTDIALQMLQSHGNYTACVKGGTAVSRIIRISGIRR